MKRPFFASIIKIIRRQFGLIQDLPQQSRSDRFPRVNWHDRIPAVRVLYHIVTATHTHHDESMPVELLEQCPFQ